MFIPEVAGQGRRRPQARRCRQARETGYAVGALPKDPARVRHAADSACPSSSRSTVVSMKTRSSKPPKPGGLLRRGWRSTAPTIRRPRCRCRGICGVGATEPTGGRQGGRAGAPASWRLAAPPSSRSSRSNHVGATPPCVDARGTGFGRSLRGGRSQSDRGRGAIHGSSDLVGVWCDRLGSCR